MQSLSQSDDNAAATATFVAQQPRLLGVSYRILGSMVDAEDVIQDAWLRWSAVDHGTVYNSEGFLTTIVTRLSIDRLRQLKTRREVYAGPWLPEPVTANIDPQAAAELADSLSLAVLVLLETLSPLERAAFVLHEVFAEPYPAVAEILGREEAAVRQLVHRGRRHIEDGGARFGADRATHTAVVDRFTEACQSADLDALLAVLAPDVVLVGDGGGVAKAPIRAIHGDDKVARFLLGVITHLVPGTEVGQEIFNGLLGLVARIDGRAVAALAFSVGDHHIQTVHLIANPAKLAALDHPHPSQLQ